MPLLPSSGIGTFSANAAKSIRLIRQGCANRPFFHIVVQETRRDPRHDPVIEQLGSFDPLPNQFNEKLVSLNLERIRYWIGNGADCTNPVAELLGLAGLLPVHPHTYMAAWRNRKADQTTQETKTTQPEIETSTK